MKVPKSKEKLGRKLSIGQTQKDILERTATEHRISVAIIKENSLESTMLEISQLLTIKVYFKNFFYKDMFEKNFKKKNCIMIFYWKHNY